MSHLPPAATRPPGRRWYIVAILIAIAGWAAMAVLLVSRLSGSADRMMRVVVPGEIELRLNEPGSYTIFHEYRSNFEGTVYSVENIPPLEITVRSRASGAALPLTDTTSSRYSVGSREGRSLYQFEVPSAGAYQLVATYSTGRTQPQTVLAIDRGFVGDLLVTILGGLLFGLGGMVAAIVMSIVVFRRRRRALQAAAAG
jgi:hypothetical protein